MTSPNPDWALIIHADSSDTRVDVYWVDIRAGRLGLALAKEVKAWRKRDDLLTLGQRFTVVDSPTELEPRSVTSEPFPLTPPVVDAPESPNVPADMPTLPQDRRRELSRHEWLRGRVAHVLDHSAVAGKALARSWPNGIPGMKTDVHSMDQLDAIETVVERIERDHSVPFYPPWDDPDREISKERHPSWERPKKNTPVTDADRLDIQSAMTQHKRSGLLRKWIGFAIEGGINPSVDTAELARALFEFASLDETEWPDDDLTMMLDGSLRAIGYPKGVHELGKFNPVDAPLLMSAAFAIAAGNAMLLFNEKEEPVVRTNIKQP